MIQTTSPTSLYFKNQASQAPQAASPVVSPEENSKKDKTEYLKIAGIAFGAALIAAGGIGLATKIVSSHKDLVYGVKKGEVSDELYNFLRRCKQKGMGTIHSFYDEKKQSALQEGFKREQVLELNGILNNDTLPIFKKVVNSGRTNSKDTIEIMKSVNPENSSFVDLILAKEMKMEGSDIADILRRINSGNKDFAEEFIEISKDTVQYTKTETIKHKGLDSLKGLLDFVKDDNKDVVGTVLGMRREGKYTSFSPNEIISLTNSVKENTNPQSTEFFAKMKAQNGIEYKFTVEELLEFVKSAKDKYFRQYTEIFKGSEAKQQISSVVPEIGESNSDFIKYMFEILREPKTKGAISDNSCTEFIKALNEINQEFARELLAKYKKSDYIDSMTSVLRKADSPEAIEKMRAKMQSGKSLYHL